MLYAYIINSCIIRDSKVIINNRIDFDPGETNDFNAFMKSVYRNYNIKYPKFF